MKHKAKLLGILMILGGIGFGVYSYFAADRERLRQAEAVDVLANVVSSDKSDSGTWFVTFSYPTGDGQTRTNRVEVDEPVYFQAQVHNQMAIHYDPANPDKVYIEKIPYQRSTNYIIAIAIAGTGLILAMLASRGGGV